MKKTVFTGMALALAFASGCAGVHRNPLTLQGGEPVLYACENGNRIEARYYTLSDRSLGFVKLRMPDGREYTLPNLVSASGARFTDERELVWWIKGDSAFVETRDENGEFRITIRGCHVVHENGKGKD
jgi:membrane-bound inhibitor of C-type lysozyme